MDGLGLRARKKEETRERIVRAGIGRFARDGYEHSSVDAIAQDAGISRRSFFRYFSSKDELLFEGQARRVAAFSEMLIPREPREPALTSVRRACLALAEEHMAAKDRLLVRHRIIESSPALASKERQFDRAYAIAIEHALLTLYRRPGRPLRRQVSVFASAIFGATRATVDQWYAGECKQDLVALATAGLDFFASGLILPRPDKIKTLKIKT